MGALRTSAGQPEGVPEGVLGLFEDVGGKKTRWWQFLRWEKERQPSSLPRRRDRELAEVVLRMSILPPE